MGNDVQIQQPTIAVAISKRFEEVDEVFLLLLCELDAEALDIKVHHVHQRCGRAIVEVRRARGQSPQDRLFEFTDVVTAARKQSAARVGDDIGITAA